MEIIFRDEDFKEEILDSRVLVRKYGPRQADLIWQRLAEMIAADNLEELKKLPAPRLHPLTGNRKGQLSVDLVHPQRLILEPEDTPNKPGKSPSWAKITKICIVEIADTHE